MKLSERLAFAESKVMGRSSLLLSAARAGITQAMDRPHEWGQGTEGFARRYGSAFAERFVGQAIEQSAALALHEDTRYFASGRRGLRGRLGYALASTFLARHDDGSRSISYSALGGAAAGSFLTRAWQPRSTTSATDGAQAFGITIAVRAGLNVAREFGPRFVGKLLP
jgi:hypothetical protein